MRRFIALLEHQIHSMYVAPSTYIASFLFLIFMMPIYVLVLVNMSINASMVSPVDRFLTSFWIPILFMVPLLTMRSLAEERRLGTLSAMMTTPVSAFELVLAKWLASYIFYVILWLLTISFFVITALYLPQTINDSRVFNLTQIISGYSFIFLSGTMFVAIGIFASSLTRTSLVAGMLSFCMLFFVIVGASLLPKLLATDQGLVAILSKPLSYINTFENLNNFLNSLIDSRPFFFYISTTVLFLAITSLITEVKSS